MSLLSLSGVKAYYGPSQVLFGVDLEAGEGEVVALLGRNGMGKTTTMRAILGLTQRREGMLSFAGTPLLKLKPHQIARLGLGLVPEGRRCFPALTVEENLIVAARSGVWTLERIYELFPRLAERKAQPARTMSGGEQQMLAIGRALATNPKLLLLDEATEGLAPVLRQEIWAVIARLKREGQSILIVDKILAELLPVTDRCFILERGRTVWMGEPDGLTSDLQGRYLGV
ncbi:MAG: ABC transporter ATP-binding protein [Pseudomonadota bacterium]